MLGLVLLATNGMLSTESATALWFGVAVYALKSLADSVLQAKQRSNGNGQLPYGMCREHGDRLMALEKQVARLSEHVLGELRQIRKYMEEHEQ